jgi:hypothetical protein
MVLGTSRSTPAGLTHRSRPAAWGGGGYDLSVSFAPSKTAQVQVQSTAEVATGPERRKESLMQKMCNTNMYRFAPS